MRIASTAAILWANLHLLFWLSLLPFATGWMGENHFARWPTALYGVDLLLCGDGVHVLQTCLIRASWPRFAAGQGDRRRDFKGKLSPVLYVGGIVTAWAFAAWAGIVFFVIVALMWLVPDRRIERLITKHPA